jgi:hypothetical protein
VRQARGSRRRDLPSRRGTVQWAGGDGATQPSAGRFIGVSAGQAVRRRVMCQGTLGRVERAIRVEVDDVVRRVVGVHDGLPDRLLHGVESVHRGALAGHCRGAFGSPCSPLVSRRRGSSVRPRARGMYGRDGVTRRSTGRRRDQRRRLAPQSSGSARARAAYAAARTTGRGQRHDSGFHEPASRQPPPAVLRRRQEPS